MRGIKGLALLAELEDGDYLCWQDRRLWLFAVRCPDEMVGGLSLNDDWFIGLGFDIRLELYLFVFDWVEYFLIFCETGNIVGTSLLNRLLLWSLHLCFYPLPGLVLRNIETINQIFFFLHKGLLEYLFFSILHLHRCDVLSHLAMIFPSKGIPAFIGNSDEAGLVGKMVWFPQSCDSFGLFTCLRLLLSLFSQLLVECSIAVLQLLLEEFVLTFTK